MQWIGLAAILLAAAYPAFGAIEYLPDANVIQVTGFPAERPCTPADLLRADQAFGWGKLIYCPTSGIYTLDCGLSIGRNAGASKYFQIGAAGHSSETLVVRGNVRACPTWLKGENPDWPSHKIRGMKQRNRLTLGMAGRPEIQAQLLLDNQTRAGYLLMIGGTSGYGSGEFRGRTPWPLRGHCPIRGCAHRR